jgi:stage IV sporulation protein FB
MNFSLNNGSFHLITIRGIPIRIHLSLPLLLGFYFLYSLSKSGPAAAIQSLAVGILVFFSVGLHELGHSFVAMHFGHSVQDIVLMLIGGAARMKSIPRKPKQEILVALAGPAVSLVVAGIASLLGYKLFKLGIDIGSPGLRGLGEIFFWTGIVNLILAIFNLLPAFPMDGGRVLRASLTPRLGRLKATEIAMRAGQGICVLFIISGIVGFAGIPLFERPSIFRVLIGFFIFNAARQEYQMVLAEETMRQRGFVNPLEVIFGGRANKGPQRPTPPPPPPPPQSRDDSSDTVEIGPSPYDDQHHKTRTHVERE